MGFLFPKLAYNSNSNNNKPITMKYITLTTLLLSLTLSGCQQQQASNTDTNIDAVTTVLENSDNILSKYLEKLDSEFTTQDVRVKILCRDYPREYQKNYMPNLLKLSPGEYSEAVLLADMDLVLDYYKEKDAIQC